MRPKILHYLYVTSQAAETKNFVLKLLVSVDMLIHIKNRLYPHLAGAVCLFWDEQGRWVTGFCWNIGHATICWDQWTLEGSNSSLEELLSEYYPWNRFSIKHSNDPAKLSFDLHFNVIQFIRKFLDGDSAR